jgi:hypothetical protein
MQIKTSPFLPHGDDPSKRHGTKTQQSSPAFCSNPFGLYALVMCVHGTCKANA